MENGSSKRKQDRRQVTLFHPAIPSTSAEKNYHNRQLHNWYAQSRDSRCLLSPRTLSSLLPEGARICNRPAKSGTSLTIDIPIKVFLVHSNQVTRLPQSVEIDSVDIRTVTISLYRCWRRELIDVVQLLFSLANLSTKMVILTILQSYSVLPHRIDNVNLMKKFRSE